VIWWIYHAVLIFAGWYGFMGGIPAFTVGLLGLVLFVGVLTERSRSIWPSVLAHGSWERAGPVVLLLIGRRGGPGFHREPVSAR
jgi:membrane protease YdiL (CAAX protease family)